MFLKVLSFFLGDVSNYVRYETNKHMLSAYLQTFTLRIEADSCLNDLSGKTVVLSKDLQSTIPRGTFLLMDIDLLGSIFPTWRIIPGLVSG